MDKRIQTVGKMATEAFVELGKLQKGDNKLVKTGLIEIDSHIGGLLPSEIITISAPSGIGKSHKLYKLLDNLLSECINPDAKDYISLEFSFEMKMLNKILRKTHSVLGKKKSEILVQEFTEEEKAVIRQYHESLKDDRRFICQEPVTVKEFYEMTDEFCQKYSDKKAIFISVDHLLIFSDSQKQEAIEKATDLINRLKLKFKNVYFILISQTNRSANLTLANDRDNSIIPNNTWLFASSFIEMVSSYIIIMVNPFKAGINEFLKFNPERYDYLSQHFTGVLDKNNKESFNTVGKNFIFVTKTRESDEPYKNLFIEDMNLSDEVLAKMKQEAEERKVVTPTLTPPPTFDLTSQIQITPLTEYSSPSDAFGDDDERPF